ncbi:MAG: hypothetical protein ABIT83_22165 [Massilia sp.]
MANTLGQELSEALMHVTDLIVMCDDKDNRHKLSAVHASLAGDLQVLVDRMVDAALPEYAAATAALNVAGKEASKAKESLDRIASAIARYADAVKKVGKLVVVLA